VVNNGKGIFYHTKDSWKGNTYDGEWKDDNKHVKGIYYHGEIYDEEFQDCM
jgi:hypothetical protein